MLEQRVHLLVKRLGMSFELAPLLEGSKSYAQFEQTVVECLKTHEGKRPRVVIGMNYAAKNFQEAVDTFYHYYGIGNSAASTVSIAEQRGLSNSVIGKRIHYIGEILAQHHKRDLWYGTL